MNLAKKRFSGCTRIRGRQKAITVPTTYFPLHLASLAITVSLGHLLGTERHENDGAYIQLASSYCARMLRATGSAT